MANLTLRAGKATPLTIQEVDANFTNLNIDKLETSQFTGAEVLSRLLTVDGSGSGLDADLLDGLQSSIGSLPNTVVIRDSAGHINASQVNAPTFVGNLTGNASSATNASTVNNGVYTTGTYPNPSWITSLSGAKLIGGTVPNSALVNSSITIDGSTIPLGGTLNFTSADLTWSGLQTFRDNRFAVVDDGNATRRVVFEVGLVSNNTTRTLTVPNANGTIATTEFVQQALQFLYPIGTIYTSVSPTNPGTTFGFGTWVSFGAGRTLIGFSSSEILYNAPEKTGGSKDAIVVAHTHTINDPGHKHSIVPTPRSDSGSSADGPSAPNDGSSVSETAIATTGISINSSGVSGTNANLPPYIVVYFWKRVS